MTYVSKTPRTAFSAALPQKTTCHAARSSAILAPAGPEFARRAVGSFFMLRLGKSAFRKRNAVAIVVVLFFGLLAPLGTGVFNPRAAGADPTPFIAQVNFQNQFASGARRLRRRLRPRLHRDGAGYGWVQPNTLTPVSMVGQRQGPQPRPGPAPRHGDGGQGNCPAAVGHGRAERHLRRDGQRRRLPAAGQQPRRGQRHDR